jgi:glycerol-3-phosphate dehydrogenase
MTETRFDRATALRRLADEEFDVLVVGGGATGAGVALDAATRGLRTALVEGRDFAYGTSSKSSKMIHGGIRYLQQGDVKLVYEALTERQKLLRNAPHLVRPLGFVIPIYTSGGIIPKLFARLFGLVLWAYDITGGAVIVGRHKRLTREKTLALMPTLRADKVHSGFLYYDARTDDARLTLAVARTAADHGAVVANHANLVEVHKDGAGKVTGAKLDVRGATVDVRAPCIVNAAGVWIDDVEAIDHGPGQEMMRPARGVHMVMPRRLVGNDDVAVILPIPGGPGTVFAVPWGDGNDFTYIGTTDTDFSGSLDDTWTNADDVRILLEHINANLTQAVAADAVVGAWAGLRPLLRGESDAKTADLSRRHRVIRRPSNMVDIAGGKLTTYRLMAQDTVDEVLKVLGREAKCRTKSLALHGASGYDHVGDGGLGAEARDHLVNRYGADAAVLVAMVVADPTLGQPLVPGLPYLRAEARYAAEHEMALDLDDIFARRTRARLLARDATADVAESVGGLVAGPLGWSAEEQARQVEAYRASVAAERARIQSPAPTPPGPSRPLAEGWVPGVRIPGSAGAST